MASGGNDLDALLGDLDQADTAVRALYRQLADNPDLATEGSHTPRRARRRYQGERDG
jgi:hypothetical protein